VSESPLSVKKRRHIKKGLPLRTSPFSFLLQVNVLFVAFFV